MIQGQFQKLPKLLETLRDKHAGGTLYVDVTVNSEQGLRSQVLVWKQGRIVYGGMAVPSPEDLIRILERRLDREWMDSAVAVAMRQISSVPNSTWALLERLVQMQLFSWEQVGSIIRNKIVLTLEQLLPYSGRFRFDSTLQMDLELGWELSDLMIEVGNRQDRWSALSSWIPSMETVPYPEAQSWPPLETADPETKAAIQHLQTWVNGQRSLLNIAEALDKDPLEIAQRYKSWVEVGWMGMKGGKAPENIKVPVILSVDDSVVMQDLIKQVLGGRYRVLVANNAVDAMSLLYHEKVALVLLDVSMPGIDGLELCRTLRKMPPLKNLPIILLTSRDKFYDKVKGQLAGATEYLTKPFNGEQLRQLVGQYTQPAVTTVSPPTSPANYVTST